MLRCNRLVAFRSRSDAAARNDRGASPMADMHQQDAARVPQHPRLADRRVPAAAGRHRVDPAPRQRRADVPAAAVRASGCSTPA
ncbi:MAG: hypothetical protein MZW92_73715 [Comamonadaceae bacterium]|nr:hypothetical protein [Comamonadaceae bacterium]